MATPASNESRTAIKKILIGVLTAVVTSGVIYLLGFNRGSGRASQLEIKKNTISTWKTLVKAENDLQPKHDSNFARLRREEVNVAQYRTLDSLTSEAYIKELEAIKATRDVDPELSVLIGERIGYKRQELTNFLVYGNRFREILDSSASGGFKDFLVAELNREYETQKVNVIERMGRSIENMAVSLSKKYKYNFSFADFHFYNYYQTLKQAKQPAINEGLPE